MWGIEMAFAKYSRPQDGSERKLRLQRDISANWSERGKPVEVV
jgi:hypothetical protein